MTSPNTNKDAAEPEQNSSSGLSRRDFIAATAATGIAMGVVGQPAAAAASPQVSTPKPENALPNGQPEMYTGTSAGAMLAQLRAAGIRTLFHTNVSGNVPFFEAIEAAGDVQVINVTHEGQGVAAAAGFAMASKGLGFFFGGHIGTGNAMSNLYNAWKDRVPLLVSIGGGPAGAAQGRDGQEEWDNSLGPTEAFTNWTVILGNADLTGLLRRAMKFAFGPPSGPVTLGGGTGGEDQVQVPIYKVDPATMRYKARAQADLIEKAAQWLVEAQNPVFVVGSEVGAEGASEEMVALAEKLSVPFTETVHSLYANIPNNHPLYLGELMAERYPRKQDLLISFGESFTTTAANPLRNVPMVHISHDPNTMGRSAVPDLAILSEVRTAIRDLSDAIDGMLTKDRIAKIRATRLAEVTAFTTQLKQSREMALRARLADTPLSWERVGYELEKALDKDAVIVPEVGTEQDKILRQLTLGGTNKQKIGRTKGQALGWGVGAALGVNVALPEKQVVALQGDGGFLFGQSETLWSIARYQAPLLIVIMNNRVYNESRDRNMQNGGHFYEIGRDFDGYLGDPNVEYGKIAEAYGLTGVKVKAAADLPAGLQQCLKSMRDGKAVVLDIDIAPDGPVLSQSTWYQRYSIADIRKKRLTSA